MKTKKDLINEIKINAANFEYCAEKGKINGSLLIDIERIMEEYADQQLKLCQSSLQLKHKQEIDFLEEQNKQLILNEVNRSLPSEKEINSELEKHFVKLYSDDETILVELELEAYKLGFKKAQEPSKNG